MVHEHCFGLAVGAHTARSLQLLQRICPLYLEVGGVVYYKAIDAEGHEYYYNSVTGESSYEPPTAVVPYDPTHSDYEYSGLNYSY